MAYQGMDVDAVEQASRDLKGHAQQLDQAIAQIDRVVKNLPSVWEGTDAQTFVRTSWPQHWRTLQAVRESIEGLGQSAWNNAQAQRDTSDASEFATPSSVSSPEFHGLSRSAPSIAEALVKNARYNGSDGFRIQQMLGSDGQVRVIVYIDGTGSSKDLGFLNNVPTGMGERSDAATAEIFAAIRKAVGSDPDRQVMIVGYSQGGMIAQNIADSGVFNVREVLTFGAPIVASVNNYGGANVTRLFDNGDPIPLGGVFTDGVGTMVKSLTKAANEGPLGSAPAEGEDHSFSSGELFDYGLHNHVDRDAYYDVAGDFANSGEAWAIDARSRLSVFDGEVIQDTNSVPIADWEQPAIGSLPKF